MRGLKINRSKRISVIALGLLVATLFFSSTNRFEPIAYAASLQAEVIDQSSAQINAFPGDTVSLYVKFKNTGSYTWQKSSQNPVNLAADKLKDEGFIARFNYGWIETYRIARMSENSVSPGSSATYSFQIKIPSNLSPGAYRFDARMVAENLGWFEPDINGAAWWQINVPKPSATLTEQSSYPTLYRGQTTQIYAKFRNNTGASWRTSTGSPVRLAVDKYWADRTAWQGSGWLSENRITTAEEGDLGGWGTGTYRFNIYVPTDMPYGEHRFYARLVADGYSWFDNPDLNGGVWWKITVIPGSPTPSPTPTPTPSPSPTPTPTPLAPAAVYGDSRTGHEAHQRVVNQIVAQSPYVVFHVGDLVNDGNSAADWDTFDSITGTMRASALFYPALGNHENNAALYFSHFVLPENERYYSVNYDNVHYIILDSNYAIGVGSDQYNWLVADLDDNSSAQFTAVLFHHPMYSSGALDPKGLIPILESLFESKGVDIVFQGHYHNYERCLRDGIYYIVTGGGGAPLGDQGTPHACSQFFSKTYEFMKILRSGNNLMMTTYDDYGAQVDTFTIAR